MRYKCLKNDRTNNYGFCKSDKKNEIKKTGNAEIASLYLRIRYHEKESQFCDYRNSEICESNQ